MPEDSLDAVLRNIDQLSDEQQVQLVRSLRTVLNPKAQHELSERIRGGY